MSLSDEDPDQLLRIDIGDIILTVRANDGGGKHYLQRGHSEEYHSTFYKILRSAVDPSYCIDIGANYGYTGLLMRKRFPSAHLTLVEPVPWLKDFIEHNFSNNNAHFDTLHSAICSDVDIGGKASFGVRETGSQDSRVILQPGMKEVVTNVVSLSSLACDIPDDAGVYIKIDTQGWEEHVFRGGFSFLDRHDRWFIKTEFAPSWLESQGSDPCGLLQLLIDHFEVFESPGRSRWNSIGLSELIGTPLHKGCEQEFVRYVRQLARDDKGWIDLYVTPPLSRRKYLH
jgi:FkbM family methyltransferase